MENVVSINMKTRDCERHRRNPLALGAAAVAALHHHVARRMNRIDEKRRSKSIQIVKEIVCRNSVLILWCKSMKNEESPDTSCLLCSHITCVPSLSEEANSARGHCFIQQYTSNRW
eukprot:scaffold23211_cov100-Skeletonema_marinoi.AAC.3